MTGAIDALPATLGVVGGGRMGSGIAHAFLVAGTAVQLVEADQAAGARAQDAVARAVRASAERGTLRTPIDETLGRLRIVGTIDELAAAELVVEAVPESIELKLSILGEVAAAVTADAVIATNTSSFSVTELSAAVPSPERFLGLHFFNPVPASKLIEVVAGAFTAEAAVTTAQQWAAALGKTAVTVQDSPGFASSRLGVLLGLEAIRMVEEGVAAPVDIDAAMTLGYGHPMGPLRLTDVVGLDVRLGVADYLAGKLGPRFAAPRLLRDMVSRGHTGRKSGRGFFDWTD
ncbi:MAG: 3-hydroxyacyl-CoA dehydrogenase family protein [Actinomycetota bacterium]|nr:3-hydroxyacyl-CoA dehydrogenase family protein [Actinomycetota bacterium]